MYEGFCWAAGFRKTSTNSEIFTVKELNPLQIGLSGGKESKSSVGGFWVIRRNWGSRGGNFHMRSTWGCATS